VRFVGRQYDGLGDNFYGGSRGQSSENHLILYLRTCHDNGQLREKPARSSSVSLQRHRRDGFAGQHLVVLPEPVRAETSRHPLLRGLFVTDAGYFPHAAGHRVDRPQGASTHLVILCLRGRGWLQTASETHEAEAGLFTWLPAHQAHAYGANDDDPWTIAWAHFSGDEAGAWRALLGAESSSGLFRSLPTDRLDEVALDRGHAALERGYAIRDQVAAASALRDSLSTVARLAASAGEPRSARERIAASVEMLRRDWVRPHRLEELAAAAGMSAAHYSALFREMTGFAPIDYLIRQRILHACRLLDTTSLTIGVIAAEVGYDDPYYFTRSFRRVMGFSPRAYRKIPKG